MNRNLLVMALIAGALASPCLAQAPAASPSAATASGAGSTEPAATLRKSRFDPNQQICKRTEELGTRLGSSKTCMTRAQWDELSRTGQDELNDTTQRSREMAPPGN